LSALQRGKKRLQRMYYREEIRTRNAETERSKEGVQRQH